MTFDGPIFGGRVRMVALDEQGREVAPLFTSSALDDVEITPLPTHIYVEVRRVYRSIHHALWLALVASIVVELGGPERPILGLPGGRLRRCRCCGCVLDNPADWPASASRGLGCAWCRAVLFDDEDAAELIWGRDEVGRAIERSERVGGAAFPPWGIYRRPVTAPTLGCYR